MDKLNIAIAGTGFGASVHLPALRYSESLNPSLFFHYKESKKEHIKKEGQAPLCGNSVWQDRRFIAEHMKKVEEAVAKVSMAEDRAAERVHVRSVRQARVSGVATARARGEKPASLPHPPKTTFFKVSPWV